MKLRPLAVTAALLLSASACEAPASEPGPPTASPPTSVTSAPPSTPSPSPTGPDFAGRIRALDAADRAAMTGVSWREGCPVGLDELRMLEVTFWGFDGMPHRSGRLVIHEGHARKVLEAFRALFEARFPIERMEPVDVYGADDNRSMEANNTSAFNCRLRAESTTTWSEHAYGWAIDINPVQNPYVSSGGTAYPPAARAYLERSDARPGMLVEGGAAVAAFDAIGWGWGGRWSSPVDYQHVSATGR